jgi:hypothetical protein
MTRGDFAKRVLKGLGAPITLHTRRAMMAQAQAEGGSAKNNMFNTTQPMPGSVDYNAVSVQSYKTAQQGIEATIKTLRYKRHGYERIVKRLKENASATEIIDAIGQSDWGTDSKLAHEVLDDIKRGRWPNTLKQLEAKEIAG